MKIENKTPKYCTHNEGVGNQNVIPSSPTFIPYTPLYLPPPVAAPQGGMRIIFPQNIFFSPVSPTIMKNELELDQI